MANNAAVQELIKESLEANNDDSEDELHWDMEEASHSAEEETMEAFGTSNAFCFLLLFCLWLKLAGEYPGVLGS